MREVRSLSDSPTFRSDLDSNDERTEQSLSSSRLDLFETGTRGENQRPSVLGRTSSGLPKKVVPFRHLYGVFDESGDRSVKSRSSRPIEFRTVRPREFR